MLDLARATELWDGLLGWQTYPKRSYLERLYTVNGCPWLRGCECVVGPLNPILGETHQLAKSTNRERNGKNKAKTGTRREPAACVDTNHNTTRLITDCAGIPWHNACYLSP